LGDDAISTDEDDLHFHGYSEYSTINIERLPTAVAYPRSTEEVSKIAKICHKYKVPMSELSFCDCNNSWILK
jgi:D-lactate dehydrogenase (cytochrome)